MNSVESELIQFLSDPKRTDSEFMKLSRLIWTGDAKLCVEAATQIRENTKAVLRQISRGTTSDETAPDDSRFSSKRQLTDAVYVRLKELLINEAGLTQSSAVAALSKELALPIPSSVRSLLGAVEHFLKFIDGSALLSAAQRVRNATVHSEPKHAWRLDNKEGPR